MQYSSKTMRSRRCIFLKYKKTGLYAALLFQYKTNLSDSMLIHLTVMLYNSVDCCISIIMAYLARRGVFNKCRRAMIC